ncbi:MAG: methylmalonyl-CoA mutase family protein, partial [Myxococcales bacterium]
QVERLADLKKRRAQAPVEGALKAVREAARGGENLIPLILDAVKAYASLGEISDALREVFGEHQEDVVL